MLTAKVGLAVFFISFFKKGEIVCLRKSPKHNR